MSALVKLQGPKSRSAKSTKSIFAGMNPPHIRLLNLHALYLPEVLQSMADWALAIADYCAANPIPTSPDWIEGGMEVAWKRSGLRCHAFEILDRTSNNVLLNDWVAVARCLALIAGRATEPAYVLTRIEELQCMTFDAAQGLQWILADAPTFPCRRHFAKWRTWGGPGLYIDTSKLIPPPKPTCDETREEIKRLYRMGTASQQSAMRTLGDLIRVKKSGLVLGGITPRSTSMLVGLSGAGKTFVAHSVAKMIGLTSFSASVGDWLISGGRADIPTGELLRRHLALHGRCVVVIDEVDKIRTTADDNQNYFRSVWGELMLVMDARVDGWPGWTPENIHALRSSFIVLAGAFQDFYRQGLGAGAALLEEEVSMLEPLTFERIAEAGILPDELINRVGSVIEVRPPESQEIAERMFAIERDAEIEIKAEERESEARRIACSAIGMRGLENYALRMALEKLKRAGKGAG